LLFIRINLSHLNMSDWYYAENNEQKGPVLEAELKGMLATHKLPAATLVWKEGMAAWTSSAHIPALTAAAPPVLPVASATANPASVTPVAASDIIGTPESLEVDPDDAEKNKIFGIIAYISILCLVPLFAAKDSPFAKYHANQGFTLFLGELVIWIGLGVIESMLFFVLPSGFGVIGLVFGLIKLAPCVLAIIGIINAAAGKCVPLPLIGGIKILK
jgi:uncharacterized membrane protein